MKKHLEGNDRVGRIIRLNQPTLDAGRKGYASIVFLGDIHYGHPQCDIDRAQRMATYCLENDIYVLGMGDYIECGLRMSVGDSVYKQKLNPQEQMDSMIAFFEPLAKAGLLIGLHSGN